MTGVSESATTWRESNRLAQIARKRKPPVGTRFAFTLSESAAVSFAITQPLTARNVNGRCVAQTKPTKHSPRCTLKTARRETLAVSGHAGANTVAFYGVLSNHHKLKLGKYALVIVATASGLASQPLTLTFTIVK